MDFRDSSFSGDRVVAIIAFPLVWNNGGKKYVHLLCASSCLLIFWWICDSEGIRTNPVGDSVLVRDGTMQRKPEYREPELDAWRPDHRVTPAHVTLSACTGSAFSIARVAVPDIAH